MNSFIFIAIGGALGAIARYGVTQMVQSRFFFGFPIATFVVNLLGCFVIGIVFSLAEKHHIGDGTRLFLATGICGGFTTFSAFSLETMLMLNDSRFLMAFFYVLGSVLISLLSVMAGMYLAKFF